MKSLLDWQSLKRKTPDRKVNDRKITWVRFSNGPISSLLDEQWMMSVVLPHYRTGYSGEDPLEVSTCANALQLSVHKARLYLFEMQRVRGGRLELHGDDRELDKVLAELEGKLSGSDYNIDVTNSSLRDLAVTALEAAIGEDGAKSKASLLRLDKQFRVQVIEPLKEAFISKTPPKHADLQAAAKAIAGEAVTICSQYKTLCNETWSRVKASQDWEEAEKVNKKIDSLEEEARKYGYNKYRDAPWMVPRYSERDKPGKIITFLEDFIVEKSTKTKSGP